MFLFLLIPRPPWPTLFPYTTLFRSLGMHPRHDPRRGVVGRVRDVHAAGRAEHDRARARRLDHVSHHESGLRSEEHTSELQSRSDLVCRLLLEKKNTENWYNRICLDL